MLWLRNRHREKLRHAPLPPAWEAALNRHVVYWAWLSPPERARLGADAQIFAREKSWEGVGGFVVTDEVRAVISTQACLLLLGWDEPDYFPNVGAIVVYPAAFRATRQGRDGLIETEQRDVLLGESWSNDLPVVVSWRDALRGAQNGNDGANVVIHEFAHKLDTQNGLPADGVPRLPENSDDAYAAWAEVMSAEYAHLRQTRHAFLRPGAGAAEESTAAPLLDPYGATNEAEFFAVCSEAFFETPLRMRAERPQLYHALRGFYRQDTAARAQRAGAQQTSSRTTGS